MGEIDVGLPSDDAGAASESERWRSTFLRAPYIRDALVRLGLVNETFETAVTWDRVRGPHRSRADGDGRGASIGGAWPGVVTCRLTHVYPDGCAPYFTVIAAGDPGRRLAQWGEVKEAVMEVIDASGGTVTHHHAVGRDHRPGYDRQRPEPFARALIAAKRELDPSGVLNPGVLFGPA